MPPFPCIYNKSFVLEKGQIMRKETPLNESCERCFVGIQENHKKEEVLQP